MIDSTLPSGVLRAPAKPALAIAIVLVGCATSAVSNVRFANREPVWRVNDRLDCKQPRDPGFPKLLYFLDRFAFRRATRLMEVPEPRRAANANSVDDVPDSTWFTNRVGRHVLTPAQIARGPNADDGPDRSRAWTVMGTKIGGVTVGFVITDARGVKYVLKFDRKGLPETETGANVVVQRLLWAAGFNVPEDTVVHVTRDMLVLANDAVVADTFGNRRAMTPADLDAALARVDVYPDGSFRGLASKYIAGTPIGGLEPEGTRGDDPNDVVPHEERRELRGQYVIFSWVDHTDVKYDNFLDVWQADTADPSVHYVVHYLVDFGNALGTLGVVDHRDDDGFAYAIDFEYSLRSLLALGLWRRPWEGARVPSLVGVGRVEAERFDPGSWRPAVPWTPFARRDRFDGFWGAKIVAAFTPEMIRAAVDTGSYRDPATADYLWRTLVARRDKIARYWFQQVTPLDRFVVDGDAVCFVDLAVAYGMSTTAVPVYGVKAHDRAGKPIAFAGGVRLVGGGRACVGPIPAGGYVILKITPARTGAAILPVEAHVARDSKGQPRVIGVHRL